MIIKKIFNFLLKRNRLNRLYMKFGKPTILHNRILINKSNQDRLLRKYRKEYQKVFDSFKFDEDLEQKKVKVIWVFWYQGIDQAPTIIKKCIESQKKYSKDYEIRIITKDNISKYVQLPDFIMEKFKKGIISFTHFSDLLRISLLAEYGGIWLDSTVLLTDFLPEYITNNKLFVYKNVELDRSDEVQIVASSWLISSYTNQKIVLLTKELLYEYWKRNNKLYDYFLFHIFFKMSSDFFKEEWDNIPTYSNVIPHLLFFDFLKPYNESRFTSIKEMSSVHKLNRSLVNNDKNVYSFYDYVIDNVI